MLIPLSARASQVLTLAQVKQHLNVEHDERDELIEIYLAGASDYVAGAAEVVLTPIAIEQRLDCWPIGCVKLDTGPVREVEAVGYVDVNGVEQVVDESLYAWEPTASGADLWFKNAFTRPRLDRRPGAIRVTFVAGYNDPDASDGDPRLDLPGPARVAVLMLVAHWWKTREPMVIGQVGSVPFAVDDLIDLMRVWRS